MWIRGIMEEIKWSENEVFECIGEKRTHLKRLNILVQNKSGECNFYY